MTNNLIIQRWKRKEKWTNTEKNKQEKGGFQSHDTIICEHSSCGCGENFIIPSMEGKKIGQIQGKKGRRLALNPAIQEVVINLHTK